MTRPFLSPHTMILPGDADRLVLYQYLLRYGVVASASAVRLLLAYLDGEGVEPGAMVLAEDASCFSISENLFHDPSGVRWPSTASRETSFDQFVALLRRRHVVVDDLSYVDRRGPRGGFFDRSREGTFHQQIGSHVVRSARRGESPDRWWIDQKFTSDLSALRHAYRRIQDPFVRAYFDEDLTGQSWLDFGCGVGYYSRLFASRGASVLGVDPSSEFIELARAHPAATGHVSYEKLNFSCREDFRVFEGRRFDRIFLCDVVSYFFAPFQNLDIDAAEVLAELAGILESGGRISIVDPHGCFFQQPWLRAPRASSIVVSEYRSRRYRSTPTLEEISRAAERAGLGITVVRELTGDEDPTVDGGIVGEYPLWWYFELARIA